MPKGKKGFQAGNTEAEKKGKNKKTIEVEILRDFLVQEVLKERKPLIKALIKKGKIGDVQALREILDRALGKAKDQGGFTEEDLPVVIIIKKGNPNKLDDSKEDRGSL